MNYLTPLTTSESSPPLRKMTSPDSHKRSYEQMKNGSTNSPYLATASDSRAVTPVHTPPSPTLRARPGPGEVKGLKITLDPQTLPSLKDRKSLKPTYREFGHENEPSAPPDPRLAIVGYATGSYHRQLPDGISPKTKVREAPHRVKRYALDRFTIGPGKPTKVVVTGFNVLTAESKIRSLLSSYGDLAKCENHIDPTSGAPLGIFSAEYKDRRARDGKIVVAAGDAAQAAEKEANGTRIDQVAIKIEGDREGVKCRKYLDRVLAARRKEMEKYQEEEARKRPSAAPIPTGPSQAPPTAPKGPARRSAMAPPAGPTPSRTPHTPAHAVHTPGHAVHAPAHAALAQTQKPRNVHENKHAGAHSLVEAELILPKMKKTPYLFLPHSSVPVLGTTIAHLKKRLRSYDWVAVRCDRTGYFVTFENSREGRLECDRTFTECNGFPLFTYKMKFDCFKNGNPNYVRSPSPEKIAAEVRAKEQKRRIRREDEADFELEKRERADNLDPVRGALEVLIPEIRDTILKEIKAKVALPHILECLHPDRHKEKRQQLGLPDPQQQETPKTILPLAAQINSFGSQFQSRQKLLNKKPFGKFTKQRPDRREQLREQLGSVYDERRKRPVQARVRQIVPLHRRLQEFKDESDSDDERETEITRDSEDPESIPVSETGTPMRMEVDDEGSATPSAKKRKLEQTDDERLEAEARMQLKHLLHKEIEDMAMGELEQVMACFPRTAELRIRAVAEFRLRLRAKQDDKLFGLAIEEPVPMVIDSVEELDTSAVPAALKTKKKTAVKKRKTKKELLAEQEAAQAEAQKELELLKALEAEEAVTPAVEEEEEPRAEVEWALSEDVPRRTVEDDPDVLLDIDGWQHLLKDEEDIKFLTNALSSYKIASIPDSKLWAWKQKEFKALNAGNARGITRVGVRVDGYYVPNATGSARTEGYKKITQPEKSKYLPHRIRVQRVREAREREAKNDPAKAIEAAKAAAAAKTASTATSRSNRVNNRRLVNEITLSKQALGSDTDALNFNQLKKRKKLVRFDRSAIHNWGLYAEENIAASDMIIEYVGEKVRQRVADLREINYQKQGIGSSYLFRIDEDTVVDATKKGGIARFINHSCMPNCTAKIIKVEGTKRIVIYALRDIGKNEELTYDYKFEREINSDDRIPCLCGSVACKGFLN